MKIIEASFIIEDSFDGNEIIKKSSGLVAPVTKARENHPRFC